MERRVFDSKGVRGRAGGRTDGLGLHQLGLVWFVLSGGAPEARVVRTTSQYEDYD